MKHLLRTPSSSEQRESRDETPAPRWVISIANWEREPEDCDSCETACEVLILKVRRRSRIPDTAVCLLATALEKSAFLRTRMTESLRLLFSLTRGMMAVRALRAVK